MNTTEQIHRRIREDMYSEEELAIFNALLALKKLPSHPKLNEATLLLERARDCVSEYIDSDDFSTNDKKVPLSSLSLEVLFGMCSNRTCVGIYYYRVTEEIQRRVNLVDFEK